LEQKEELKQEEQEYCIHRRFDRVGLLVGHEALEKLWNSSITVIGLGGVGSFAAEALVRSGIGHIRLIDFDKVCITNSNRQLQAMQGEIGHSKVKVLAKRLQQINPQANIEVDEVFFSEDNADELLTPKPDFIVDAIDNFTAKCYLIAECKRRDIPIVVSTGAASRFDPTSIQVADLAKTHVDPMAQAVRRILRKKHGFPQKGKFGVLAVFSTEKPISPQPFNYQRNTTLPCICSDDESRQKDDEEVSRLPNGTFVFTTGSFGLVCASVVVRQLLNK